MALVTRGQTYIHESDIERIIYSQVDPYEDFENAINGRPGAEQVELYRGIVMRLADSQEEIGEFANKMMQWGEKNQSVL